MTRPIAVDPVPALEDLAAAATAFAAFVRTHDLTAELSADDARVFTTFYKTFPDKMQETSRVLRAWHQELGRRT